MKVLNPVSGFQPGDPTKGLGIPKESDLEGQRDLIIGLSQDFRKQTPVLEWTNKILHTPRPRGEEQWPHRRLNQIHLQCWRASCGGVGRQGLTTGPGALAAAVWEGPPWHKPSWSSLLTLPGGSADKESACNAGDLGPIAGLGRSSGEGNGYPL